MHIPSYQIQNVLKVYSRQVSQGKILARNKNDSKTSFTDSVSLSMEGKRRSIIDRVTNDIVDKIITEGASQSPPLENEVPDLPITYKQARGAAYLKNSTTPQVPREFTYTAIDKENNKTSQTLSMMDPQFISTGTVPKDSTEPAQGSEETDGGQIT